jgi:hypothetical protein
MELLRKNYKKHLQRTHPGANYQNLCGLGQKSVGDFFTAPSGNPHDPNEVVEELVEHEDDARDDTARLVVGDEFAGQTSGKRRHESGDSAYGGDGVDDEGLMVVEAPPKKAKTQADNHSCCEEKFDRLLEEMKAIQDKLAKVDEQKVKEPRIEEDSFDNIDTETLKDLHWAKTMKELEKLGFFYDDEQELLSCFVCKDCEYGEFEYEKSEGLSFEDGKMSRKFINLKKSVKRHICKSKSHSDVLQDIAKKEAAELKIKSKNFEAGMNLGRLCIKSYKLGKPYQDYEIDTFLLKKSGASIGELNHSRKFPAAFRPHVQQEVRKRQQKFLSQPLKQTGHLPPLAGSADKGTYKHRSRHFLGVITVNPGGTHFLEQLWTASCY